MARTARLGARSAERRARPSLGPRVHAFMCLCPRVPMPARRERRFIADPESMKRVASPRSAEEPALLLGLAVFSRRPDKPGVAGSIPAPPTRSIRELGGLLRPSDRVYSRRSDSVAARA